VFIEFHFKLAKFAHLNITLPSLTVVTKVAMGRREKKHPNYSLEEKRRSFGSE
jgi:hypothetical protein